MTNKEQMSLFGSFSCNLDMNEKIKKTEKITQTRASNSERLELTMWAKRPSFRASFDWWYHHTAMHVYPRCPVKSTSLLTVTVQLVWGHSTKLRSTVPANSWQAWGQPCMAVIVEACCWGRERPMLWSCLAAAEQNGAGTGPSQGGQGITECSTSLNVLGVCPSSSHSERRTSTLSAHSRLLLHMKLVFPSF